MKNRQLAPIALIMLAAAGAPACASDEEADRSNRASSTVEACRGHDGVAAFDDEAVICEDGTYRGDRAANAVEACRGHRGVSAFDDDIVICGDQTAQLAEGG